MAELVLSGSLAGKRIRVWQGRRGTDNAVVFQFGVTGKGWRWYCLFHQTTAEECFDAAVEVLRRHYPRARLHGPYNEV